MRLTCAAAEVAFAGEDSLFAAPSIVVDEAGHWFVLHVKSRQEKALAEELRILGISHLLPLVTEAKYHGNRKVSVKTPLFPGYLFLRGTLSEAYRAGGTKRIARVLPVANQKQMNWELRNLHVALFRSAPLEIYPYLRNGVRVEVRAGPFRGLQGIITERTGRDRLILQVAMLSQAASLEIDGSLLEPVS